MPGPAAGPGAIAELREIFDLKATDVIKVGRYSHLKRERLRLENGGVMIPPQHEVH